ncbi:hypothetical protein RJT34_12317 [Clitoria ternatea]|uniref:Alcohol dehydrogenase-like C-terminal domain-containing protein n=1 Tax=Clitoria ternatea TaxID=43366 RepID=A0AAN9JP83_CLITE
MHSQYSLESVGNARIASQKKATCVSEYTVLHAGCVAKINPAAPLEKVCVVSCAFCTGFGATVNVAKPKPNATFVVFGLGAVGLAACEGARVSGASRIIGLDLLPNRFEQAKQFGVTEFVNPKDYNKPVQQVLVEMTNGGVDHAIECTGNIQASISAFECTHDGWGVAVLFGVPKKDVEFKTHPTRFMEGLLRELELDKFITHSVPFSEINKAFDLMLKGEGIRCLIRMDE